MAGIARVSTVWKTISRLRRTDKAFLAFKYGVPYAVSTLMTFAAAEVVESFQCGDGLAVLVEWLAENTGFYGMALACGTFRHPDPQFGQGQKPLRRILAAEGLDTIVRKLLLLAARRLPIEYRPCGAAMAGVLADVSFCFLLAYSERLLGWCGWITEILLQSSDHVLSLRGDAGAVHNRI